jgi:hypothetical protein
MWIPIIMHIFKEGKRDDCNNHRRIRSINSCYKICEQILNNRISKPSEMLILKNKLVLAKATPVHLYTEFSQSFG